MGLFSKKENISNKESGHCFVEPLQGLPVTAEKSMIICYDDEKIIIKNVSKSNSQKFELKYENIINLVLVTKLEYIEKQKSVIGRGIVGSMFGPVGTVIGAMSGVGTKTKGKKAGIMAINYINYDKTEANTIILRNENYDVLDTFKFNAEKHFKNIEKISEVKMFYENIKL